MHALMSITLTLASSLEPRLQHPRLQATTYQTTPAPPRSRINTMAFLRSLLRLPAPTRTLFANIPALQQLRLTAATAPLRRTFNTSSPRAATYNQVLRGCRQEQRARKPTSPALVDRPEMKGVCIRVGTTKPKKPNSGERKVARVRLSSGRIITAYIPGEGGCARSLLSCGSGFELMRYWVWELGGRVGGLDGRDGAFE